VGNLNLRTNLKHDIAINSLMPRAPTTHVKSPFRVSRFRPTGTCEGEGERARGGGEEKDRICKGEMGRGGGGECGEER
jgi:hypothetical protein